MSKAFYSDFANHCLRFYTRHENPTFNSEADRKNWEVCRETLAEYPEKDREILFFVYHEGDTVADNIYQICKQKGIEQDGIWKLVNGLERTIAQKRGLI